MADELDEARHSSEVDNNLNGRLLNKGHNFANSDDAVVLLDDVLAVDGFHQIGQSLQIVFGFLELLYVLLESGVNHVVDGHFLLIQLAATTLGANVASFRYQFLAMLATDRLSILLSFFGEAQGFVLFGIHVLNFNFDGWALDFIL